VTLLPMAFVGVTTVTAAILNIKNIYLPQTMVPETFVPGLINLVLTVSILVCVVIIFYNAVPQWIAGYRKTLLISPGAV
jgi:carbon starvation protein CstA